MSKKSLEMILSGAGQSAPLTSYRVPVDNISTAGGSVPASASAQARSRTELATALAQKGALTKFHEQAAPFEALIVQSAAQLYEFFHVNGYVVEHDDWKTGKVDLALTCYRGWVYAFYAECDVPLYVGESGRTLKARFTEHEKKQKLKAKPWWPSWKKVKVLPCPDQTMRKVFEALIGLSGGYVSNIQQPRSGDNIFDDITLSLLLLGNNQKRLPVFPRLSEDT